MKKKTTIILIAIFILLLAIGANFYRKNLRGALPAFLPTSDDIVELIDNANQQITPINNTSFPLSLPNGYNLSIFAKDLIKPRVLAIDQNGVLIASITKEGKVVALPDTDNDGKADRTVILAQNLNNPHGLIIEEGKIYIAESDNVSVYGYDANNLKILNVRKLVDLPGGGNHSTRTLLLKGDEIWISTGSSCNVCVEKNSFRATIHSIPKNGGDPKLVASGLRNAVFMTTHPKTGKVWVTEMGRDLLGDDTPPDEINIVKPGNFYGWPFCFGKSIQDTSFDSSQITEALCKTSTPSHIDLQAHSAPLGLAFLDKNTLLVAYHGSWNRTVPTGYKIMKFTLDENGNETTRENFITGWINDDREVLGRPVDILKDGKDIFISDDKAGVVYLLQQLN